MVSPTPAPCLGCPRISWEHRRPAGPWPSPAHVQRSLDKAGCNTTDLQTANLCYIYIIIYVYRDRRGMERERERERGKRGKRVKRERERELNTTHPCWWRCLGSCIMWYLYHIFTKSWGIPLILEIPTHTKGQATAACWCLTSVRISRAAGHQILKWMLILKSTQMWINVVHALTCFDMFWPWPGMWHRERNASWNFHHIHMPLAHRLGPPRENRVLAPRA